MCSSLRCFSSQSVSTSASGCTYSVGCVAIGVKISGRVSVRARGFVLPHDFGSGVRLAYIAWEPRRREQLLKLMPAFLRLLRRAAALLDITAHHVLAEIVVD